MERARMVQAFWPQDSQREFTDGLCVYNWNASYYPHNHLKVQKEIPLNMHEDEALPKQAEAEKAHYIGLNVDEYLWLSQHVGVIAGWVYLAYKRWMNWETRLTYPSYVTITKDTCLTKPTIIRAVKTLIKAGVFEEVPRVTSSRCFMILPVPLSGEKDH